MTKQTTIALCLLLAGCAGEQSMTTAAISSSGAPLWVGPENPEIPALSRTPEDTRGSISSLRTSSCGQLQGIDGVRRLLGLGAQIVRLENVGTPEEVAHERGTDIGLLRTTDIEFTATIEGSRREVRLPQPERSQLTTPVRQFEPADSDSHLGAVREVLNEAGVWAVGFEHDGTFVAATLMVEGERGSVAVGDETVSIEELQGLEQRGSL